MRVRTATALVVMLIMPLVQPARVASAASKIYERTSRPFQGVDLRTRGFLNDDCLQEIDYPCLTLSTGTYRQEATAQARTIQQLSSEIMNSPIPLPNAYKDKVQWEVSPGPDPSYHPDDAIDLPEGCPSDGSWRIDIVVDRSLDPAVPDGGTIGVLEVKNWNGGAARALASSQLNCYIAKAAATHPNLAFTRENSLNVVRPLVGRVAPWSRAYAEGNGSIWCVWADPVVSFEGQIYFARQSESIPDEIRERTPGCDSETEEFSRKFVETVGPVAAAAGAVGGVLLIRSAITVLQARILVAEAEAFLASQVPVVEPATQITNVEECVGYYTVSVAKDPVRPTTLKMDYGDGSPVDLATIPQGSGTAGIKFSHEFPYKLGVYLQRATLIETGRTSGAVTVHPPPETCVRRVGSSSATGSQYAGWFGGFNVVAPPLALSEGPLVDGDVLVATVMQNRLYAFEWGERVRIRGAHGRVGQVTPPA